MENLSQFFITLYFAILQKNITRLIWSIEKKRIRK